MRAGLNENKRTGAVGVLRHALRGARLPEQRGLLVAGDAGDVGRDRAARIDDLRHVGERDAEELRHLFAPLAAADVEKERARRVGGVGDVSASLGKPGDEPRVHGAGGRVLRALDVLQRPRELGRREIGI